MKTETIKITNMDCSGCARNVKNAIIDLPGVSDVQTNLDSSTVSIEYNGDKNLLPIFRAVLEESGYPEKK